MKHLRLVAILVAFFIFFVAMGAQAQMEVPVLPDLTGQQPNVGTLQGALNGKDVNLKMEVYSFIDWDKLERHFVQILYDEDGKQWLAYYRKEVGEKLLDGDVITKGNRFYFFENLNGIWVLVKEFEANQSLEEVNKELDDLIRNRYKLEYRR